MLPCLFLLCLQLDKAAADASEYKAGFDKVVADSVEQKAQVRGGFMVWQHYGCWAVMGVLACCKYCSTIAIVAPLSSNSAGHCTPII